jgi:glycosyltransferase involved in cell wall biosynthesis
MYDVSVSIITYNRKDILRRVLDSFRAQTYPGDKFEVVLVDDGSTDGTEEMVRGMLDKGGLNIRYFREDHPGKTAVRNLSVERARSGLVLIAEDDTIADKNLVAEHIRIHREFPGENVAVVGYGMVDEESIRTPFGEYVRSLARDFFENLYERLKGDRAQIFKCFCGFNLSVKRDFLLRNGRFDSEFDPFSEDIELGRRLQDKGLEIVGNKKAVVYDAHPISLEGFCQRNVIKGYMNVVFERKYPGSFDVFRGPERTLHKMKDMFYPVLMKISSFTDEAGIKLPCKVYRKLLEYYLEKGMRKAQKEKV